MPLQSLIPCDQILPAARQESLKRTTMHLSVHCHRHLRLPRSHLNQHTNRVEHQAATPAICAQRAVQVLLALSKPHLSRLTWDLGDI